MVIDGTWSVIGSCNFDPRSLLLNLEFFAVIRSAELATALTAICRYERRLSDLVKLSDCRKQTLVARSCCTAPPGRCASGCKENVHAF